MMLDKHAVVGALLAQLDEELSTATRLAREAASAATHEEARPESQKDMRSTEAAYVARGQAERVHELTRARSALASMPLRAFGPGEGIELSALVELLHRGARATWFIALVAGGRRVRVGGVEVMTVTPTSPLGSALVGLVEGDEVEVASPQGPRAYEVVRVA